MRVSPLLVPILIVALAAAGVAAARMFAIPTVELELDPGAPSTEVRTLTAMVDGIRCADTALQAAGNLTDLEGVSRYVAYASHARVEISYDAGRTDAEAIRAALEAPIWDAEAGEFLFNAYRVVEIDGESVHQP